MSAKLGPVGFATLYSPWHPSLHNALTEHILSSRRPGATDEEILLAFQTKTSEISSRGFAYGFAGQFVFLVLSAVVIFFIPNTNQAYIYCCVMGAVWSFIFGGYCFYCLERRFVDGC